MKKIIKKIYQWKLDRITKKQKDLVNSIAIIEGSPINSPYKYRFNVLLNNEQQLVGLTEVFSSPSPSCANATVKNMTIKTSQALNKTSEKVHKLKIKCQ